MDLYNNASHFPANVRTLGDVSPLWIWSYLKRKSSVPIPPHIIEEMSSKSNLPIKNTVTLVAGAERGGSRQGRSE